MSVIPVSQRYQLISRNILLFLAVSHAAEHCSGEEVVRVSNKYSLASLGTWLLPNGVSDKVSVFLAKENFKT